MWNSIKSIISGKPYQCQELNRPTKLVCSLLSGVACYSLNESLSEQGKRWNWSEESFRGLCCARNTCKRMCHWTFGLVPPYASALNLFSLWFPSKVAGDFQLSLMAFMFNAKPGNSLVHSLPVSHFILCCFPVESSNTPFPFAKLQASHRGTTRWLSQALRVGKKLHVPPDSQTQRLCSCCLSWEWVGEAWVHHISSNPHNQLMAWLVKTGVTKSRGLSV